MTPSGFGQHIWVPVRLQNRVDHTGEPVELRDDAQASSADNPAETNCSASPSPSCGQSRIPNRRFFDGGLYLPSIRSEGIEANRPCSATFVAGTKHADMCDPPDLPKHAQFEVAPEHRANGLKWVKRFPCQPLQRARPEAIFFQCGSGSDERSSTRTTRTGSGSSARTKSSCSIGQS